MSDKGKYVPTEWLEECGATVDALRARLAELKAGVPWADLRTCLRIADEFALGSAEADAVVRAYSWLDRHERKEVRP